ncbi:MAG: DNA helicase UvrD [Actinomycetales bacterium]|nr:MAG: DNA helicase UvrD [Actinomycetales bacterium]
MVQMRRARRPAVGPTVAQLDAAQRQALSDRSAVVRVLGGPGTGKTELAVHLVLDRVNRLGLAPESVLVLSSTRSAAGRLRELITARLARTVTEPIARTPPSFAFAVLRREAALRGDPPPRLLSGPEQDVILRELLAGHAAHPSGSATPGALRAPDWPDRVRAALGTRGFRAQLRDLLMRAVEHGVDAPELARLGAEHQRPEWVAAAQVLDEYDQVTALSRPGAYDPAWIAAAATDLLDEHPPALARLHDQLRLVVVDDAQELTWASARLLSRVVHPGLQLVLIGDPDSAVQTFRGGDPRLLWHPDWPAVCAAPTHVLDTAYRTPEHVHAAAGRVAQHIGALGGGLQRQSVPAVGRGPGQVQVALLRSTAQEAALVASTLRRAHLHDGMPWNQMAVIVRGRARSDTLRRVLTTAGVPVVTPGVHLPVRHEVAVRPLLMLLDLVVRWAMDPTAAARASEVVELLGSPLGGADAVSLRRLRRHLRRDELDAGGRRRSDELLVDLIGDPVRAGQATMDLPEGEPLRRLARALAAGLRVARRASDGLGWQPGVTAETVLWEIWSALELAGLWRATALRARGTGGRVGAARAARADRDLDAVLALFDAAARFTDRLPMAGPDQFLDYVRAEEVPGDTLVQRTLTTGSVELLTPAAAAGRQWSLVCVAGVQEGVWPDLRLRGSLLGSEALVDVVTGRASARVEAGGLRAARTAVGYDETRLFHVALTRSSDRLLVSAVRCDDEQPSPYLDVLDPVDPHGPLGPTRPFTTVPRMLTLPAVVGELRREAVAPDPIRRASAARLLATLADDGVPGADPAHWWGLTAPASVRPRRQPDQPVKVSPSALQRFATCPLQWVLVASGGSGPPAPAAAIGTLVHEVLSDLAGQPDRAEPPDAARLQTEIDRRWPQLGLAPGWVTERKRSEAHAMAERAARYIGSAEAADWQVVGVEIGFSARVGRARVAGTVDRLERHVSSGALRVIDYKTGATKTRAKEVPTHPQLAAYQAAVESGAFAEHGARSAGAALLQLGRNAANRVNLQRQPPLSEAADPHWAAELLDRAADGMGAARFAAISGPHCDRCPVRTSCPARPEGGVVS